MLRKALRTQRRVVERPLMKCLVAQPPVPFSFAAFGVKEHFFHFSPARCTLALIWSFRHNYPNSLTRPRNLQASIGLRQT